MKIILRDRHTGRTEELIRLCAEAEARGECSYIVCLNHVEAYRIAQEAKKLDLFISFPITSREFLNAEYSSRNIKNFFIDNADQLLQSMTAVPIQVVTMEQND